MKKLAMRSVLVFVALFAVASAHSACTSVSEAVAPADAAPQVLNAAEGRRTWVVVPELAHVPELSTRDRRFPSCALPLFQRFEPDPELPPVCLDETGELDSGEWEPVLPVACPQTTLLRVVDAQSGRELGDVSVADGRLLAGWGGVSGLATGAECFVRDVASPVDVRSFDLDGPQARLRRLIVRAKGHAAERVELDLLRGGVQTVELEPEAPLRVVLKGVDPALGVRLSVGAQLPGWMSFSQRIDHDGWLEIEGLKPGTTRVVLESWSEDLHTVHASTAIDLRAGEANRVVLDLRESVPAVRTIQRDTQDWRESLGTSLGMAPPRPSANLHPRCGSLVLELPADFHLPQESELELRFIHDGGFNVVAARAGQYELVPPEISGFHAPGRVLVTLVEGRTSEYVLEYERVPRASGAASR